ncbi:hypothetical protein F4167_09340 [Candidatus Poribacteria bacterium]|nr:hypothetical protein [Candidatus Poribacteria bacterium]
MNDKSEHHWSFDYNYGAQNPQFTQELIGTLKGCYTDTDARDTRAGQVITHIYNILPNYWRGYAQSGAKESLSIGTVIVERSKQDGLWNYVVQYENTTSGEHLRMRFRCCDVHYRPLTERWRVDAQNSGDDKYSELTCEGFLVGDSEVRLHINGTEVVVGTVGASAKLTCNWAFFDVIPALAQTIRASGNGVELTLLEDLEQLRPKSRLGFLESVETPFPLEGYYVYGAGLLPSYWWLDVHGNIAIASTYFETLVLREKIGGIHE